MRRFTTGAVQLIMMAGRWMDGPRQKFSSGLSAQRTSPEVRNHEANGLDDYLPWIYKPFIWVPPHLTSCRLQALPWLWRHHEGRAAAVRKRFA